MPVDYVIARQIGTASENILVRAENITTGVGIANIVASTVGFSWCRNDQAAASSGTCTTGTLGTYSVSSWVQVLSTGMLGWYNFGIPNGVFSSGRSAAIRLSTAAMNINVRIELTKTDNQTYFSSQALSTNALVNINQILGSAPVTSAAGVLSVQLTPTGGDQVVDAVWNEQISTHLSTGSCGEALNVGLIFGSAPVTTGAGVLATAWDLGRTANLTSTIALTGTTISSHMLVDMARVLGSTPVTTAAGKFSVGITGTQTYDITGSLSGSVGSVTGSVASVTGLNAALLDVSVSSRLATAGYTAPDNTGIANVSSKTAQLTFTTTNALDTNVTHINEVLITGDGSGTPFNVV